MGSQVWHMGEGGDRAGTGWWNRWRDRSVDVCVCVCVWGGGVSSPVRSDCVVMVIIQLHASAIKSSRPPRLPAFLRNRQRMIDSCRGQQTDAQKLRCVSVTARLQSCVNKWVKSGLGWHGKCYNTCHRVPHVHFTCDMFCLPPAIESLNCFASGPSTSTSPQLSPWSRYDLTGVFDR